MYTHQMNRFEYNQGGVNISVENKDITTRIDFPQYEESPSRNMNLCDSGVYYDDELSNQNQKTDEPVTVLRPSKLYVPPAPQLDPEETQEFTDVAKENWNNHSPYKYERNNKHSNDACNNYNDVNEHLMDDVRLLDCEIENINAIGDISNKDKFSEMSERKYATCSVIQSCLEVKSYSLDDSLSFINGSMRRKREFSKLYSHKFRCSSALEFREWTPFIDGKCLHCLHFSLRRRPHAPFQHYHYH